MKNKIIIFVVCVSLSLSVFGISSFAASNDFVGDYCFNENLVGLGDYFTDYHDVPFYCGDDYFTGFNAYYMGRWVLQYVVKPNDSITYSVTVYDSNSGWVDESYMCISLSSPDIDARTYMFLLENQFVPDVDYTGWFFDIKDMLYNVITDGEYVGPELEMVITLVSVIFCLLCVSVPILVVLFLIKYVLSMRFV